MEVGGQRQASAAFPRGKTRYPLCRRLGGPQGRSGRVREISPPCRDSIPGPSSVALPTELSQLTFWIRQRSHLMRLSEWGADLPFCFRLSIKELLYVGLMFKGNFVRKLFVMLKSVFEPRTSSRILRVWVRRRSSAFATHAGYICWDCAAMTNVHVRQLVWC